MIICPENCSEITVPVLKNSHQFAADTVDDAELIVQQIPGQNYWDGIRASLWAQKYL